MRLVNWKELKLNYPTDEFVELIHFIAVKINVCQTETTTFSLSPPITLNGKIVISRKRRR